MKISIGCDHAGFEYKEGIKAFLESELNAEVTDCGTHSTDSVDYPDFVHPVAKSVSNQESQWGILICGSANGVCMTANKHSKVRAAIAWQKDIAALSRQHNDANIICIPARFITLALAKEIVHTFATTEFEGGRHQRRVDKIACH